jgi:serine phosphatase RsbU (regulator of sigma subunit)
LIAALREHSRHSSAESIEALIRMVQKFGGSDQADDQTLIVARVTERLAPPTGGSAGS